MIDVSVVIVSWNGKEILLPCLQSLARYEQPREVILVDNGSTDGTVDRVRSDFPEVKVIMLPTNERFARANNIGVAAAVGENIFLLNNDTILIEGILERLVSFLRQNPAVGMVGPRLLNPDRSTQTSCHGFVSLRTHLFDMLALDRLFLRSRLFAAGPCTYLDYSHQQEVDHVMAAAVLVRRTAMEQVGPFDEKLSIYYNDLDWSLRFRRKGWLTIYFPATQLVHLGGSTMTGLQFDRGTVEETYANIMYYFWKYFGGGAVVVYRVLLFCGFVPRAIYWGIRSIFGTSESARRQLWYSLLSIRIAVSGSSA